MVVVVVVVEEEEVEVEVVVVVVLVVVALLPLRAPPCVSRGRRMLGYLLASHYLMWRFFLQGQLISSLGLAIPSIDLFGT